MVKGNRLVRSREEETEEQYDISKMLEGRNNKRAKFLFFFTHMDLSLKWTNKIGLACGETWPEHLLKVWNYKNHEMSIWILNIDVKSNNHTS